MLRDLKNSLAVVHLLDAQSETAATVKPALLDTKGFEGAGILINFGAYTIGTGSGVSWKLREGDTTADSGLSDVAAADYIGTLTGFADNTGDQMSVFVAYKGSKRYVTADIVVSANSTSQLMSVDGILSSARVNPPTAPAAVART